MWRTSLSRCVLRSYARCLSTTQYKSKHVETKWQSIWKEANTQTNSQATKLSAGQQSGKHAYVLSMFPYPSGNLHMGHVRVYTISDCIARLRRMQGYQVLHPMGWDAFGLPAENAAMQRSVDPGDWTSSNIAHMKTQLESLGFSFDWDKELATYSADYYKWTQWIFLQLLKNDMAYQKQAYVNWDPIDQTVLANEQVDELGRSWRSGALVERRMLKQWFVRITHFQQALLDGLDELPEWPEKVKTMQKNWIGKSVGHTLHFRCPALGDQGAIPIFTTRLDTLFGVSFVALAPEHSLVSTLLATENNGVVDLHVREGLRRFTEQTIASKSECDRASNVEKGFDTTISVIHPMTGKEVPVFVASYVLPHYASGGVMGVPAHDARDMEFASYHSLPIVPVVSPNQPNEADDSSLFTGKGVLINSDEVNGMSSDDAATHLSVKLADTGVCSESTQYKLKDWLVSRQRYWGTPIPTINCVECGVVPVPEADLPVKLPRLSNITAKGGSPLASEAALDWRSVACPKCGLDALRETDTLDTFVDSSWYFLRYLQPNNNHEIFDSTEANQKLPVDVYIGGVEHAVLHLLYARFVTHFLNSTGLVSFKEPFRHLLSQGMVHGKSFKVKETNRYVTLDEIGVHDGRPFLKDDLNEKKLDYVPAHECAEAKITAKVPFKGARKQDVDWSVYGKRSENEPCPLDVVWEKMSKSKHNGVEPEDVIAEFGADTARLFMLFKAPFDKVLDWDVGQIQGQHRWLLRVWALVTEHAACVEAPGDQDQAAGDGTTDADSLVSLKSINALYVQKASASLSAYQFNVAISELMKFSNELLKHKQDHPADHHHPLYTEALSSLVSMLAPLAPHIASELWSILPGKQEESDIHEQAWPESDPNDIRQQSFALVVQVGGKKHVVLRLPMDTAQNHELLEQEARQGAGGVLEGLDVKRVVVVTRTLESHGQILVNFVIAKKKS